MRPIVVMCMLATLFAAVGCMKPQHPGADSAFGAIQAEMDAAARQSQAVAPPPDVMAGLLPPLELPAPVSSAQRFDLAVHDLDAGSFFMGLVQDTADNMLVHPDVSGVITLNLRNVTIAETMEMVRDVYGYDFRRTSAGWQVFPATLQSRLFVLNNLHLHRRGETETQVSAGGLHRDGTSGRDHRGTRAGSTSRVATDSEMHFWNELEKSLAVIVKPEGGRSFQVNPHTGIVMVRALPGELREVESFLQAVQDNVVRQVILEAKILEVELSDGFQSGINWLALGYNKHGQSALGGMVGGSQTASGINIFDSASLSGSASTLGGVTASPVFSAALRLNDFAAFIELLQTQGEVQVLSSPRVATMNNQKALIKVGQDEFFVSDISTSSEGVGVERRLVTTPTLAPFFSGIALDVTPSIAEDGMIMLHVRPLISDVREQDKVITVDNRTTILPMALSRTRESDTVVRARSGQIVIIGGLMQDTQRDRQAGVPGLSRLPMVGGLFRHTNKQRTKTELVILIRPMVVDGDHVWTNALEDAATRMHNIYP
ncbi:pilus (MSHA type) biogenesis protein MshL [Desulfonatronum parangueonense]